MVEKLREHSLTVWLAVLWLGLLLVSFALASDIIKWLADTSMDMAGNAFGAFVLLFFGRILWLHERGRADKRQTERPDV